MQQPFRFGVVAAYAPSHTAWITTARRTEELGYATLLMPDRANIGSLAPLTALAVAAEATTVLRVGSYVLCNGVGAAEFQQLGIPFANAGTRVGRLEETLQLIKHLFTEETVNFSGKYYTITEMKGYPRPVQKPRLPLLVAGAGERMLKVAAREADIIAIGSKITERGVDPTDATLEQKIAWIKEAAGERFADLELSQTIYDMMITDSGTALSSQAGGPPIPKRPLSTEQAIAHLVEQRDRYGFSYLQIYEGQMENFAPVVARLTRK